MFTKITNLLMTDKEKSNHYQNDYLYKLTYTKQICNNDCWVGYTVCIINIEYYKVLSYNIIIE